MTALAQSELEDTQIKAILSANKMNGALLETTTNQLANAASANKMAKAQKAASTSTLELGEAFKGLGIKLGNMLKAHPILAVTTAVIALGAVIGLISDRINNAEKYAKNALDKSAEKVNAVKSEIESLNSELQTTKDRINELKSKENLSLVEQEELQRLKESNDELEREIRLKQSLLSDEQKKTNEKAKDYFSTKKNSLSLKPGLFQNKTDYIGSVEERLDWLQKYADGEIKLPENMSNASKALFELSLKGYVESALSDFMEEDDYLVKGQDDGLLERLDALYEKYDIYTNGRAHIIEDMISGILAKADFDGFSEQLVALGKSGELSVSALASRFPKLIDYLDEAGISAEELYQYIMALANPDAVKYDEVKRQLMEASGIRDGEINGASDVKIAERLATSGILSNEGLDVFLKIKGEFDTSSWDVDDWISNIQKRLNEEFPEIRIPASKTLSDLKDLNTELDNLGNAMANLDSEGNFDLGSLDSIADYFLGLEGISYDADAVNNALKSLGDENTSIEEQADAINSLADQYLKTSGILDHLNEENKELIKFQLERMGISNAETIVDTALNQTLQSQAEIESVLAQYKSIVTGETLTLANVTAQELKTLFAERTITNAAANQMAVLAIKKQLVNGNTLNASADINNLIGLCKMLGTTTTALDTYNKVKNGANGMPSDVVESYRKQAEQELQNAIKTGEDAIAKSIPKVEYNGGSAIADLLKDTGNAAAQAKENYKELFDFFERRVDVLNDALELLNANLENVAGSNAKNFLIDAQIGIHKESANNYTDALSMYQQKAVEALSKVPENLRQMTVEGSVSMTDFIGSGNEEIVNAIKDYQQWSDKVSDCRQELVKLKETIRQLELDKFNNIIEDFTNRFDISTNAQSLINKQIDLFEEAGELIGKGFYEGLIKESEGQLSILEQEKQALVNELNAGLAAGTIEAGTDEWLEMVNALNDVDGSILDCKKDIEEFNNSIQKLHWDIIDRIQDNFSDLSDEISNLVGLINDADVSDKEGIWTPEGLTQLGLYAQEYERAVYSAQMYADEIEKLNQAYMEGGYSATEYADKLSELKKAQWNEINASEEAKDAIVDLNKARIDMMVKGIEDEIDAMKELTNSKTKALDAEKDLNDYRNSLTEKNKSITDLERQIAAMQNDTTAASVAKRKNLEEQLAEAKRELADFEYEHSIEVQKETLNHQYEDFETEKNNEITALQNTLNEQETLIAASFETIKQNAAVIGNELSLIASNHGITISESLTTAWQSGSSAIASYGTALTEEESRFILSLGNMVMSTYSLQEQADMTAVSLANMYNTNSSKLQSDLVNSYYYIANVDAVTQALQASLVSTLDRGYDVSSLVNQIDSIGDSAANAADSVNALMDALERRNAAHKGNLGESYTGTRAAQGINGYTSPILNWLPSNTKLNLRKYAKGGIVTKDDNNPLNTIAKSVGEDTLIAAKDGESILTPVQTTEFMRLTANMEAFNSIMPKPFNNPALNNISAVQKAQPSVQIHYDNLVQVQGDVNNSNIRQMESIVNNAVTKQFNQFNSELYKRGVR